VIDRLEIFRRLPKSARIKDLYGSQVEVLQAWFANRDKQDHVLKLHTGGGKTLVGLLMDGAVDAQRDLRACPFRLPEQTTGYPDR
jgi:hypothetical protein